MSKQDVVDFKLIDDYLENLGKSIVEQMLSLYVEQSSLYLKNIDKSANEIGDDNAGNAENLNVSKAWRESCHKMKSAAASVGLLQVRALLASMESGQLQTSSVNSEFEHLTYLNQSGIEVIKKYLHES